MFCFRILKAKRWMYNISDGFQDFENKRVKIFPKFQVKIRFLRNRVKIGKSGLPGIKILGINSYYHLKYVCKVSSHNYLYFRSYLEFKFCKNRGNLPFWLQVVSDYSQKFDFSFTWCSKNLLHHVKQNYIQIRKVSVDQHLQKKSYCIKTVRGM